MFMIGEHLSTITNPWQEYATLNCEKQQNFTSKKLRKSAEFRFKNLVQFGTSFRHYVSPGKSGGSRMHVYAQ
jgi:hypothetical protein